MPGTVASSKTGLEDAVDRRHRTRHVVDVGQRLRADEAIEAVARHVVGVGEVGDERRSRIAFVDVEDVALRDAAAAEQLRIGVFRDFEDAAADVECVPAQECLDVVAIDGLAAALLDELDPRDKGAGDRAHAREQDAALALSGRNPAVVPVHVR